MHHNNQHNDSYTLEQACDFWLLILRPKSVYDFTQLLVSYVSSPTNETPFIVKKKELAFSIDMIAISLLSTVLQSKEQFYPDRDLFINKNIVHLVSGVIACSIWKDTASHLTMGGSYRTFTTATAWP